MKRPFHRKWLLISGAIFLSILLLISIILLSLHQVVRLYQNQSYSLELLDRRGERLAVFPVVGGESEGLMREWMEANELSPQMIHLILTSEDQRFLSHWGVDWVGVARALKQNSDEGTIVSGASTITMQLVRQIRGNRKDRSWSRKIGEAWDSLGMELYLSKKEILSGWLSNISFGFNVEGLESASWKFFNKRAAQLKAEEAALLMILPRSPQNYHPIQHGEALKTMAAKLLTDAGISYYQKNLEKALETMQTNLQNSGAHYESRMRAPHFSLQYQRALAKAGKLKPGQLRQAEFTIQTTLDYEYQRYLEERLREAIQIGQNHRLNNGAALVLNPQTGAVLAWVGSANFFDEKIGGQNDGVLALHQPGSTLKPFIYELALEKGWSASQVLPDIPMEFNEKGALYRPMNFDNRFSGPVRLREALASSLNLPAIWTTEQMGVPKVAKRLLDLGMSSVERQKEDLGVGIAVGALSLNLYEITKAYATLANYGRRADGKPILKRSESELIIDILMDYASRIRGFGQQNPYSEDYDFFIKTGTSNQFNDIWAFASAPELTVGVWMGNFSGETVMGTTGSALPSKVAVQFLNRFVKANSRFCFEGQFEEKEICSLSGELATPWCPKTTTEKFIKGQSLKPCSFHSEKGLCLPTLYHSWAKEKGISFETSDTPSQSVLQIKSPIDGGTFYYDSTRPESIQRVPIEVQNSGGEYLLYLNEGLLYRGKEHYSKQLVLKEGSYTLSLWENEGERAIQIEERHFVVQ